MIFLISIVPGIKAVGNKIKSVCGPCWVRVLNNPEMQKSGFTEMHIDMINYKSQKIHNKIWNYRNVEVYYKVKNLLSCENTEKFSIEEVGRWKRQKYCNKQILIETETLLLK